MGDALRDVHSDDGSYKRSPGLASTPCSPGESGTMSARSYFSGMEVSLKDHGPEVSPADKIHISSGAEPPTLYHDKLSPRDPLGNPGDDLRTTGTSPQPSASHPFLIKRKIFLLFFGIFVTIIVGLVITIAIVLTRPKKNST